MADPLPRAVTLSDGTRVEIRFIRPDDKGQLRAAFDRLSPSSRVARFLAPKRSLSDAELARLTEVDGRDHVAIVAVADSPDLKTDLGLGVARFVRLPPGDVAEGAITVADHAQNKGLGRALLAVLAELAEERGIRAFRAEVLASNRPILRLLEAAGGVVVEDHGDTLLFHVDLAPPPDATLTSREHPLRRMLRAAAEALTTLHSPS